MTPVKKTIKSESLKWFIGAIGMLVVALASNGWGLFQNVSLLQSQQRLQADTLDAAVTSIRELKDGRAEDRIQTAKLTEMMIGFNRRLELQENRRQQ